MSNPSPSRQRDLKPTLANQNAYSASPSQLTLTSDLPSSALGHPYHQQYSYGPTHHDSSNYGFPQQHYRPTLQTQPIQHQQQSLQQNQQSPSTSRKRRVSDLELPGSSGNNAGAYGYGSGIVGTGPVQTADYDTAQQQAQVQPQLPSPVAKKGRTNTPWTPAEEQRLKALRDAGSSWSEIAKTFPTRTEGSVKKHWYKDMHYAEFASDEVSNFSANLLQAIKEYENNKWKAIGAKVGKPAKACEQFAKDQGWKV